MKKREIKLTDDEAVALANFLSVLIDYVENIPNVQYEVSAVAKQFELLNADLEAGVTTLYLGPNYCEVLATTVNWFCNKIAPKAFASPKLKGNARKVYMQHYNQAPNIIKKLTQ